jgi:hypothetical protein
MQLIDRQERLGSAADGRIALSRTFVAPAFTADKKSRCDIKFVKWRVRKNRALSMSKKDDELNEFVDEVTDGAYNLPCVEVILKLVKQMQAWGDERIKNIVVALAADVLSKYDTLSCLTGGRRVFLSLASPGMPS